jgi:hypothetical protein
VRGSGTRRAPAAPPPAVAMRRRPRSAKRRKGQVRARGARDGGVEWVMCGAGGGEWREREGVLSKKGGDRECGRLGSGCGWRVSWTDRVHTAVVDLEDLRCSLGHERMPAAIGAVKIHGGMGELGGQKSTL